MQNVISNISKGFTNNFFKTNHNTAEDKMQNEIGFNAIINKEDETIPNVGFVTHKKLCNDVLAKYIDFNKYLEELLKNFNKDDNVVIARELCHEVGEDVLKGLYIISDAARMGRSDLKKLYKDGVRNKIYDLIKEEYNGFNKVVKFYQIQSLKSLFNPKSYIGKHFIDFFNKDNETQDTKITELDLKVFGNVALKIMSKAFNDQFEHRNEVLNEELEDLKVMTDKTEKLSEESYNILRNKVFTIALSLTKSDAWYKLLKKNNLYKNCKYSFELDLKETTNLFFAEYGEFSKKLTSVLFSIMKNLAKLSVMEMNLTKIKDFVDLDFIENYVSVAYGH
jgi:hypothetical protein